ncbi:MAG: protein kinase [Gammaproteobacteria bacterium]|nr:protein kinase [Gammaproteobacteria bacterium]MYF38461.1 protein kinase [Gammaproteobacteria bacterium]
MNSERYEELEIYRQTNGWQCALALDTEREQSVAVNRFHINASLTQSTVEEYLESIRLLSENPHPNVVSVLECGIDNDHIVVVTEWMEAEDLNARKERGMSFDQIVSMSTTIATALQHLHTHGIVHRSISPESVLFEAETQVVRLDLPLWKLDSSESSGTPDHAYDAPEVRSSQLYSNASDFYSMGILLYSTLTGSFPWVDQNGTVRLHVEEDVVPRLPLAHPSVQQAIEDMLAYRPSARKLLYENVFDFVADKKTDSRLVGDIRYRSGLIDVSEIQQVALPLDQPVSSSGDSPTKNSRFWLYSTVMTVAVFGILASVYAYINFDGVKMLFYEVGLGDHPELSERWRRAESLGRNQSLITIITAYNKVLELNPNHNGAHQAISDAKTKRREDIESLIRNDEFAFAQDRLDEYRTVVPNDPELAHLVTELEHRQRRDQLLADARPLVAAGMEDLALLHAAVLAYKTVLRLFPDSEEARQHLHEIAVMYATAAIEAANASDIQAAQDFFEKAKYADPDAQELDEARDRVELAKDLETDINTHLQRAKTLFDDGLLITPPGPDNAMSTYRQVLVLDADNDEAKSKLVEIEERLIEQHQKLLEEREFGAEKNLVLAAEQAGVSEVTLDAMSDALEKLQNDRAEAASLYREAQSLFQRGYISKPANENAIAVLRRAQALDAKNTDVTVLLDQCAERSAAVALEAYGAGLTDRAIQYMDVALSIQPMNDVWSLQYQSWTETD